MTNGFTKRKVGTMTLGEKLRKLRSDKRIALNEVSRVTKIRVEYLQRLEEGKYDELPADVYVRGFLKSYGDFLGVDERSLVKLFEKEKGIKKNLEKSKNPDQKKSKIKPLNISAFVFTPKKIVLFFVGILVLGVFFYLYREAGSLTDTPRLIILNPGSNSQVDGKNVLLEGKTDKDARVFINDQLVLVDDDGRFREDISLQSGINVIHVRAVNKFQKEAAENITVQSKYVDENADSQKEEGVTNDSPSQDASQADDMAVQIELSVDPGPVWISAEADGNLIFSGTVLAGAVQKFSAHDKITISSGQANATYIKLNGEEKGTLGKESGAIKGVVFAKEDKKQ
ncbi:MAG: RodZ domain-containing protein [Candidatus Moraniibacteriota bacterium]